MRRIVLAVLGLSLSFAALSDSADARTRSLRSVLFGIVSKPLEVLRPPSNIGRRGTHRRPAAARTRQPSPAATEAGATAAATQAPGAATAAAAVGAAAAASSAAATPAAATAGTAPPAETAAAPAAAPSQRSAAVSQPSDEPLPRARDASRAARNAPPPTTSARTAAAQLGVVGPPTWPAAYEDILGFTLWPDKYGERLRAHGIGDVMSTLFAPSGGHTSGGGQAVARSRAADATRSDADGTASACAGSQPASTDWPAKQIEQALALSEPQRAALDQLRAAVGEGVAAVRAACRDDTPSSSAERLRAMQSTLWAVRDATLLVRAPLINFYRSLTDEQKRHFIVQVSQPDPRLAQMNSRATQGRGMPQIPRELARMCGMSAANEWPMRQIEQALRPSKEQKASIETLQKKSIEMGQLLMVSCLQPIAAAPEKRLDAASDRLTAMLFAITNISLAFNDLHGQLSEEQKTKLGAFGL